ncbi:enoyl-CoA hydratase PHS1 LALA0_S08e06898g [Lachancea lanzarotensis]|uniref:Very-long-chain (3R)-3-hydroxyacyl-CoA dehydratase n=1 Tax=Lachancea lanzarotensis TaxID=1245769 RepID=A0A0C7MUV8_9SACH|nr:uncharacterized protein LALA0_S08e06898g [Lachancea lanzarotensis]CEP63625.1 LALA0S08e06898g1_1 [Lachancea lanzarotensis]
MAAKVSPVSPLALYNLVSAGLWGFLLFQAVTTYPKVGQPAFFYETEGYLTVIQCGALIEILNSVLGIVRAPLLTTVAQVASRLLVTVGIFHYLPEAYNAHNAIFLSLLTAWSVTEIVRYLFYFFNLTVASGPPKVLVLLRYNLFWLLYPMGVASELLIIYSALSIAEAKYSSNIKWALAASMLIYIPGFPMLYSHMVVQRKKVMKSLRNAGKKQA